MKQVGILALQGDFAAHEAALAQAGAAPVLVRNARQFGEIDGLIIPGGESTSLLKLLRYENMMDPLAQFAREKPVFGTCMGAILLAKEVTNPAQDSFAAMDIGVERNAYGRQNESRIAEIEIEPEFRQKMGVDRLEAVFIRAPIIRRTGAEVKILAQYAGSPVLVAQGRHLAATFHPELTKASFVHSLFISNL